MADTGEVYQAVNDAASYLEEEFETFIASWQVEHNVDFTGDETTKIFALVGDYIVETYRATTDSGDYPDHIV